MTRILAITDSYPDDMISGAHIRVRNLLTELARRHDCYLVTVGDLPSGAEPEIDLGAIASVSLPAIPRHKRSVLRHFRLGNSKLLRRTYPGYLRQMQREISALMKKWEIELIVCMAPITAELVSREQVPKLIDYCDSRILTYQRMSNNRGHDMSIGERLTNLLGFLRQWFRERSLVREFDLTTTISHADQRCLADVAGVAISTVEIIPNGVSPEALGFQCNVQERKRSVVFWGNLDFPPNWTAIDFFYDQIFVPYLVEQNVALHIIGKGVSDTLKKKIQHPLVHWHGYIADLYKEIAMHGVMINPMVEGSGLKNKVLEAFACGVPVVSTTIGIEAVGAVPGKHFLLADAPENFSASVLRLLDDPSYTNTLVKQAHVFVQDEFDWSKIGARFSALADRLVQGTGSEKRS